MEQAFFDGWTALLRTLVVGILAYASLIFFLRATGKRTLSKMNAFDFVVTVALGSTLATILLSQDVSLAQGCLAMALLIGLQYAITWSSARMRWIRRLVTGEPTLLLYRGVLLDEAMRRSRVTDDEIVAAVRASGFVTMEEVGAVVLETDGSFSVVPRDDQRQETVLGGMENPDALKKAEELK